MLRLNSNGQSSIGLSSSGFSRKFFYNPRTVDGIAARKTWSPDEAESVIRHCVGGVIIGMPRWRLSDGVDEVLITNEYSQYEGALLRTLKIPILILAQEKLLSRCVFENSFGLFISRFPEDADSSWLDSLNFQQALRIWLADISDRRDIFLGYCSSSSRTRGHSRSRMASGRAPVARPTIKNRSRCEVQRLR